LFPPPSSSIVMKRKLEQKPKLTDSERFQRFREMAKEVEASENPKDFEKAFDKVARPKQPKSGD